VLAAGHAALLAYAGGQGVKLFYEPGGESCWYPEGSRCRIRQSTALDREGRILGVRMEIFLDVGAYRTCTRRVLRDALSTVCGIYRCANIEVVGKLARTNTQPAGLSGSTTQAAAAFATELQQTRLAEISQLDPYVWKREQLQPRTASTQARRGSAAAAVLERAVAESDFCRKHAAYAAMNTRRRTYLAPPHPLRGVGLSLCVQNEAGEPSFSLPASPRNCSVKVRLEADNRLHIYSSIVENGQRRDQLFTAAAAEYSEEQEPVLEPVDTLTVPDSGYSSLAATLEISRLIEKCCQTLKKQPSGAALPLEARRSIRFAPENGLRRQREILIPKAAGAWAATVVEVEVDAETLYPSCRRIVMAVDAGAAGYVREQLKAGILRALGRATWEGRKDPFPFSDSQLAPAISVEFVQTSGREQHCKAFDALPDLGVAAAFASAVSQATGLYIDQIPLTAEVIQRCLLAAEK
jgi:CO/xanthine dehydrogenase Mo-binding subunit